MTFPLSVDSAVFLQTRGSEERQKENLMLDDNGGQK